MPMIETMTFRLVAGADEAAFRAADERLQSDFAYQQPGLLRRTTARREGTDEWIVVDVWSSAEEAAGCAQRWERDPVVGEFLAFVDASSVEVRRYHTLD